MPLTRDFSMPRSGAIALSAAALLAAFASPAGAATRRPSTGPVAAGVIVSPQPSTPDAEPQTQISILGVARGQIKHVAVVGSSSGRHAGRIRAYSTGTGASFIPKAPFRPGEDVRVSFDIKRTRTTHVAYHFSIGTPGTPSAPFLPPPPTSTTNAQSFLTRPDLHPTDVAVTTAVAGVAPGYEFVAPIRGPTPVMGPMFGQYGPTILDTHGNIAWFRPAPAGVEDFNFAEQMYKGEPVLTWWEGKLSPLGVGQGVSFIYDDRYRQIATVAAGNGLSSDLHDFIITPRGTALLMAYEPLTKDLTPYGGAANAPVFDNVIQEIDIKTGLVMWEWHEFGNVDLADSESPPQAGVSWDPAHLNSIQELANGNIVISNRNTWSIDEINKATGKFTWRLGGKKSTFALAPGAGFAWQHDGRVNPDANVVTLFDDEAAPPEGPQSRGLTLKLDLRARTATAVHAYDHTPSLLAGSQGNMQTLPNGDEFVGWGAQPAFTEFTSAGNVVFDAHFIAPIESYRAYRFQWTGHPPSRPTLVAKAGPNGTTLYVSWNGDTLTANWQFLAGASLNSLSPVATIARNGFETSTTVANAGPYFAVRALTPAGRQLSTSATVKPS
jgi:Arylsulfotransferase (ASST)